LAVRAPVLVLALMLIGGPIAAAFARDAERSTARVAVDDKRAESREDALADALAEVLRRATGDPGVAERGRVQALLERPGDFLQRFGYERGPDDTLELVARFDDDSVRQALIEAEVAVWQRHVPPVLIWAAIEDDQGDRALVGAEEAGEWREAFVKNAARLGIEVTFPRLDLADQEDVGFSDVAGGFPRPIEQASQRYDTPLILMGSLRASGGQWRSRWQVIGAGSQQDGWRSAHPDVVNALAEWRRQLAAQLRKEYTVLPDPGSSDSLPVRITGIQRAQDFGWVQAALADVAGVTDVTLKRVEPEKVRWALGINVDRARVIRGLDRDAAFQRADRQDGERAAGVPDAGPIYRLQR